MEGSVETKVIMWGKHDTMSDLVSLSKIAQPENGCLKYTNVDPEDSKRYIYFIKDGNDCPISTIIHNAQEAEAQALVIEHIDTDLSEIVPPDHINGIFYTNLGVNIPIVFIPNGKADPLFEAMRSIEYSDKTEISLGFKVFIFFNLLRMR